MLKWKGDIRYEISKKNIFSVSDQLYFAVEFLREAYETGKINEIENWDELIETLDVSSEVQNYECFYNQFEH